MNPTRGGANRIAHVRFPDEFARATDYSLHFLYLKNAQHTPINQREGAVMWAWIKCYLSGSHDYGISCEPGAVFLRCVHCGHRRSQGWAINYRYQRSAPHQSAKVIPPLTQFDTTRTTQRQ